VASVIGAPQIVLERPLFFGLTGLLFVFAIPIATAAGLLATVLYRVFRTQNDPKTAARKTGRAFLNGRAFKFVSTTPSAWDHLAQKPGRFVRVQIEHCHWVGGELGNDSFSNTSSSPHEMYIEKPWAFDRIGTFVRPMENSVGLWINCRDAVSVEKIRGVKKKSVRQKGQS